MIDLGLGTATARYLSKMHAEGDEEGVQRFLGVIYKLYIAIDTVILVALTVFFFLLDKVYVKLTPAELALFKIVYLIAADFNVINFPFVTLNGILTAYEKFIPLKLADVLYRVMLVGMTIAALLLGYGLYGLVLVHTFAGLLTMCFKLIVIKRGIPIRVDFRHRDKSLYKELFTFSRWATIASLAQRLIFTISPSILGAVSGSAAVAVFGVVVTIEGYVYTITTAINGLFSMTDEQKNAWSVIGGICGTSWDTDFAMTETEPGTYVSEVLELKAGEEFKCRQGAAWDVNFGVEFNGANIVVEADGKYQVQLVWDGAQTGTITLIPVE
jgi:O-antigen/teichoic acid export membrane protein